MDLGIRKFHFRCFQCHFWFTAAADQEVETQEKTGGEREGRSSVAEGGGDRNPVAEGEGKKPVEEGEGAAT